MRCSFQLLNIPPILAGAYKKSIATLIPQGMQRKLHHALDVYEADKVSIVLN